MNNKNMTSLSNNNNIVSELRSASSADAFESSDQEAYRSRVIGLLNDLVSTLREGIHIPSEKLEQALYASFDWSTLTKQHDRHWRKVSTQPVAPLHRFRLTPLQEICSILTLVTAIPTASSSTVFMCLMRVFIEQQPCCCDFTNNASSNSRIVSPWETLVLDTMIVLAKRVALRSILAKKIEYYILALLNHRRDANKNDGLGSITLVDSERINAVITALSYLTKNAKDIWFGIGLLSTSLLLLKRIDDMDIALLDGGNEKKYARSDGDVCLQCQRRIVPLSFSVRRIKRQSLAQMLDGGEDEYDSERAAPTATRPTHSSSAQGLASERCTCASSVRQSMAKASSFTRIPFEFVLIRSRLYQQLLDWFSNLQILCGGERRGKYGLSQVATIVMDKCLYAISQFPLSPSLRLVLLLVSDSLGFGGYLYLSSRLLRLYKEATRRKECGHIYLCTFAEVIVESSHFDEVKRCWKVTEELRSLLQSIHVGSQFPSAAAAHLSQVYKHITIKRRLHDEHVTTDQQIAAKSKEFIESLSNILPGGTDWLSDDAAKSESEADSKAFAGSAPISEVAPEETLQENDHLIEFLTGRTRSPFPELFGIRQAHRRMGPHVVHHRLLSALVNETPVDTKSEPDSMEPVKPAVPIMAYINDDVLAHIQSFFSCVELVRASGVCKSWKAVSSDRRWKQVYRSTHGILGDPDDIEKVVSNVGSWKNLFVENYYSEKALKFQYSSSGWKFKTCGYIGCYQVMRNPEQQAKHFRVHEDRINKKKERIAAAAKRAEEQAKRNAQKEKDRLARKAQREQKARERASKKELEAAERERKANERALKKAKEAEAKAARKAERVASKKRNEKIPLEGRPRKKVKPKAAEEM